jgi:hypothetical protein
MVGLIRLVAATGLGVVALLLAGRYPVLVRRVALALVGALAAYWAIMTLTGLAGHHRGDFWLQTHFKLGRHLPTVGWMVLPVSVVVFLRRPGLSFESRVATILLAVLTVASCHLPVEFARMAPALPELEPQGVERFRVYHKLGGPLISGVLIGLWLIVQWRWSREKRKSAT